VIRASSAQDAELCGYIRVLQQRHPRTYRKTIMGSAAHAKWSVAPDAKEKLFRCTDEERAEVESWSKPIDFKDEDDIGYVALSYEHARKEEPVGLDEQGCFMEVQQDAGPAGYVDQPGLLVPSTVDMWWGYDHPRGRTVFVGDIKTGEHAIPSGARNLQFVAPALALADRDGADWYRTGIWYAREGRWELGPAVHVSSALALQDLTRLQRAATNPPVPVVGAHCNECFQRAYCDAYVLPVSQAETALAPLTAADKLASLTPQQHLELYTRISGWRTLLDTAHDTYKAWFEANGPVKLDDGSTLGLQERAGREYADAQLLRADGLTKYIKRSKPSRVLGVRKP